MVYGSKGGVIMSKNDDIQYWVDRFIPLFRDYFSDVIDEKEFEEKTGILHMEMEQNFPPDELVLMDCIIEGMGVQEYNKSLGRGSRG